MKNYSNDRANHKNLDLSHFFNPFTDQTKKIVLSMIPYFASAPLIKLAYSYIFTTH